MQITFVGDTREVDKVQKDATDDSFAAKMQEKIKEKKPELAESLSVKTIPQESIRSENVPRDRNHIFVKHSESLLFLMHICFYNIF